MVDVKTLDINELLPQHSPMVMIDRLVQCDMVITTTQLEVKEDNIFFEDGRLTPSGLIENIAQTCAARMGYINKYLLGDKVKLGFIGAIRNLEILRTPCSGETLTTTIEVVEEVFKMTLVNASIKSGDEVIVKAEMKIALSDIDSVEKA
jgi:predicted hotdog family 3-hydroxylacyl-ACP dehydratase